LYLADISNTWKGDLFVAFSANGVNWRPYAGNPVLSGYGEVWTPYYDEARHRYGMLHRWNRQFRWTNAEGRVISGEFRLYGHSTSPDFKNWTTSELVFAPGPLDSGATQFYSTSDVIQRGDLLLTMLSVLRDDLQAPGTPATVDDQPVFGLGYTVLAWSRDGGRWMRDYETEIFFEPDPNPAAWDHAHAWIDALVPMGDEVFLYYGGYRYGHKIFTDRGIGLVRLPRDRYVAREAGAEGGVLRTPTVVFDAGALTLNVDAAGGEIRLQILDANGSPLPGFTYADCRPVAGDFLDAPISCTRPFDELRGLPVQLEFTLRYARLFAFSLT
jgi:hypothetical protein